MENIYRTNYCNDVCEGLVGKEIRLAGFVENIRDHGGVIFLDVRDSSGIVQVVSNDDSMFSGLTKESSVSLTGVVRKRNEEDYNDKISTGKLEVLVSSITLLGKALNELPFDIKTSHNTNEEVRNKYRYLYLRSSRMQNNLRLRSDVLQFLRNKMCNLGFMEVQTPILTASSPEGARDFVVPSRKFKGKFYALPQAPQIFKQLLMVSGVDKYFQIAPCFRDEDTRADRTMEFYQLDFEMSFATEEDVYRVGEDVFYDVFSNFSQKKVSPKPFRRISYEDAMLMYGSDKPDLRNPLVIMDLTHEFSNTTFKPFQNSIVRGIKVDGIATKSNSWFNEVVDYAKEIGMPGIGYITVNDDMTFKGPIDKFLSDSERESLINVAGLTSGSVLFFIADKNKNTVSKQAGLIRTELGRKLDLIDNNRLELCIINDFPMFEYNEDEKKYDFGHNPFSMPQGGMDALNSSNIEDIKAYQFDFVCNGYELASGAVRNHDVDILEKAFSLVGYDKEVVETKFGSLYNAFKFGAPPHAGMGPGIDRIIMLLTDEPNLREVQAFPPLASGQDLMMGSPSELSEQQLREVHIKIRQSVNIEK